MKVKIGIIGGSGLSNPEIFSSPKELIIETPFGNPSDALIEGQIDGVDCVLLARHGRHHTIYPTAVNYRANLHALKQLGCTHVIVSTACGSLQERIKPGNFVVIDQFIDRTTKRCSTFYDGSNENFKGILHLPMDTPFCPRTRKIMIDVCSSLGLDFHSKGTMIAAEGPRFSSKAESLMFRQWGGDTINMTTFPEVVLARELGLCYGAIAIATDYDCWKEGEESVSVDVVMSNFKKSTETVLKVLKATIAKIAAESWGDYIEELQSTVQSNIMGLQ